MLWNLIQNKTVYQSDASTITIVYAAIMPSFYTSVRDIINLTLVRLLHGVPGSTGRTDYSYRAEKYV